MSRLTHFHDWIATYHRPGRPPLPGMLVIIGPPSSGKTTLLNGWLDSLASTNPSPIQPALRRFAPPDRPSPSLLAQCFDARQRETPTQVARRLNEELGFHPRGRSATDLWREAAGFLREAELDLLIIDQAERLSLAVCQCVRDYLVDQHICTLLLVGSPVLTTTLQHDPSLVSRVFAWRSITAFDHSLNALTTSGPDDGPAPTPT